MSVTVFEFCHIVLWWRSSHADPYGFVLCVGFSPFRVDGTLVPLIFRLILSLALELRLDVSRIMKAFT